MPFDGQLFHLQEKVVKPLRPFRFVFSVHVDSKYNDICLIFEVVTTYSCVESKYSIILCVKTNLDRLYLLL